MSSNNESQCYFVQLQIDSYLDGDLSTSQQESFLQHVNSCARCAREFRYAKTVQDGLLDLPLLDCSDEALAPARDLAAGAPVRNRVETVSTTGIFEGVLHWVVAAPPVLRYALPVLVLATLAFIAIPDSYREQQGLGISLPIATTQSPTAATTEVQYSPEEVAQALQDLNLAIQYLNEVSERTENMIGRRFLMTPLQDSLNASFERVRENIESDIEGEEI